MLLKVKQQLRQRIDPVYLGREVVVELVAMARDDLGEGAHDEKVCELRRRSQFPLSIIVKGVV